MGRGGGGRERLLGKCFLLQRSPLCARKKYLKCAPRVYFISLVGRGYMMENFSPVSRSIEVVQFSRIILSLGLTKK